jgi:hypothetical protein
MMTAVIGTPVTALEASAGVTRRGSWIGRAHRGRAAHLSE